MESSSAAESPAATLPTELVEEIFLFAYVDHSIAGHNSAHLEPPLNIAGVCSAWRSIALSIPCLWSSLCVTATSRAERGSCSPPFGTVESWLDRSHSHPLTLSLTLVDDGSAVRDSAVPSKVLQLLLNHYNHWESIHIDFSGLTRAFPFPNYPNNLSSKMLRNVELRLGRNQHSQFFPFNSSWISGILSHCAPEAQMESFCMYGESRFTTSGRLGRAVPYATLTSVVLESCSDTDSHAILRTSPCLRAAHITITATTPIDPSDMIIPRVHHQLERLSLSCISEPWPWFLWHTFPALEELELAHSLDRHFGHVDGHGGPPEEPFLESLQRSAPPIQKLALSRLTISPQAVSSCLSYLSGTLAELRIHCRVSSKSYTAPVNEETLKQLTPKRRVGIAGGPGTLKNVLDEELLCPHLGSLALEYSIDTAVPDGLFSTMVQARFSRLSSSHFTRPRAVYAHFASWKHQNDIVRMQGMYKRGLEGKATIWKGCAMQEQPKLTLMQRDPLGETFSLLPPPSWTNGR